MDGDGDLHALQAEAVAADEVVAAGLGERDEVLAGGPVSGDPVHGAVVVPRLVHLEHVVRPLLVPERDEVADVEGLVAGPEGVVDVGVPPVVGAHDVVRRRRQINREAGEHGDGQEPRHGGRCGRAKRPWLGGCVRTQDTSGDEK